MTATLKHATKTVVYGRYAAIDLRAALLGLALGASTVLESWSGRKPIERMPDRWFGLLTVAELSLIG